MSFVWNNRLLKTKLTIFNSNVKSDLLYGSETWKHIKALDSKLQVFVNTCLRQILRIRWPDTISNEDHNKDHFQRPSRSGNGGGLGTPYDQTQPASQDRHSTGTPKGSADKAVQPRLVEEAQTLNFSHMGSPLSKQSTKHRTVMDGKPQFRPYDPEGTKRINGNKYCSVLPTFEFVLLSSVVVYV